MTPTQLERWQLLIDYKTYCTAINGDTNAEHDWFDMDQKLALSIIYKNMTQTHIFPMDKHMFRHMKEQYRPLFIKALSWQIKYINDNQDLYNNPTQYLASHTLGTSSTGPITQSTLDTLMNVLAPKARYYLEQMGWMYTSLTDHYELCQYYDEEIDDYALKSDVAKALAEAETYTDLAVADRQIDLTLLDTYDKDKYLHTNENSGSVEWVSLSEMGKVDDVKVTTPTGTESVVVGKVATIDMNAKQSKVIYSATQPANPKDNDVWVSESLSPGTIQQQANWTQNDATQIDYIKNKPNLTTYAKLEDVYKKEGLETDLTKVTYSAAKINNLIETSAATFRGTFDANQTQIDDATNFINSKVTTKDKNDYVYLHLLGSQLYKKYQYNGTDKWDFVIEVDFSSSLTIDLVYPIGSIYMTLNSVNPGTLFTGTIWERLTEGVFLENSSSNLGAETQAGLPNITGNWREMNCRNNGSWDGAFTVSYHTGDACGSGTYAPSDLSFNASLSNPIYGRSTTVQPHSIKVAMWKRVA